MARAWQTSGSPTERSSSTLTRSKLEELRELPKLGKNQTLRLFYGVCWRLFGGTMSLVRRTRLQLALVTMLGFVGLLTPSLSAAAPKPRLRVLSVMVPVPPGAEPDGQMFLQARVKSRIEIGKPVVVSFYLANNPFPGVDDVVIGSKSVRPGSVFLKPGTVAITGV